MSETMLLKLCHGGIYVAFLFCHVRSSVASAFFTPKAEPSALLQRQQ
jgi:hypothetical protein